MTSYKTGVPGMKDAELYNMFRSIIRNAQHECKRGEYKPKVILDAYHKKLMNLHDSIKADSAKNRKVQAKQGTMIQKCKVHVHTPAYDLIHEALQMKLKEIPSAIELYMKEREKEKRK